MKLTQENPIDSPSLPLAVQPVAPGNRERIEPFDDALHGRRRRIRPPAGVFERTFAAVQDWLESRIAAASIHGDPCVYDPHIFPWVAQIESEWQCIRSEVEQVMTRREEIPSFHEILSEVETITRDDQWKTFFLAGIGLDCRENSRRCPETMRLLSKVPGMTTAFFSILSPRKHIPAHRGAYNGVLRYHLGLIVPEPRAHCRIRIANETWHWEEGKTLIFDDTYNHEVWNDTAGYRVILFVDFPRPLSSGWRRFNETMLRLAPLAPFLREARGRHKRWENRFYKSKQPVEKL